MKRLFASIAVIFLLGIIVIFIIVFNKYKIVKQVKYYLDKNGKYTVDIHVSKNISKEEKGTNYLIKGNKEKNKIYGNLYVEDNKSSIIEFYMNTEKTLFNLKTTYNYALERLHLSNINPVSGLITGDIYLSKEKLEDLFDVDIETISDISNDSNRSLINTIIKLKKCDIPKKDSYLIKDDSNFDFYYSKYKNTEFIIGIGKNDRDNLQKLYLKVKQTDKVVEIKYSIQEDDDIKIIFPEESKLTCAENFILNKIIKTIKELKSIFKVAINSKK